MVIQDEKQSDCQIEQNQNDLDPTVEEASSVSVLNGPLMPVSLRSFLLQTSQCLETVDVLDARDFNEIGQLEELLEVLFSVVSAQVINIDDFQDSLGSVTVNFVVIVEIENICKEGLGLHVVQLLRIVFIMSIINYANVVHSLVHSLLALGSESLLVLVKHVCEEQICQEVEPHEHEEHEKEGIEVVYVHRGQEDVWEVGSREQNCHVAIRVLDRAKVLEPFESRPVEIVNCERENQDIGEDCHQNIEGVHQVTQQTEALLP